MPSVPSPPEGGAGGPITEPVVGNPPTVLGVLDVFQTTDAGHTQQSRRSATRLVGFQVTFNEPLDSGTAAAGGNYMVLEYERHGRKLATQSIAVRASYDPNAEMVSLVLIGEHPFRQGGGLVLKAARPNGITSPSGAPLVGNTRFTILPRAGSRREHGKVESRVISSAAGPRSCGRGFRRPRTG